LNSVYKIHSGTVTRQTP